jgi:hypothetical protein
LFASLPGFAQINILFVGNSLTYTNDLPSLVKKLGKKDGVKIKTEVIAFPNYALEDHWNETNVSSALRKTKYDYVIFQQGPSGMPDSRANLVEFTLKFSALCKENNAKMCMYTVWPSGDRSFDFVNVIKSYEVAADTTESILLPAGVAWKKVFDRQPTFPLYSMDGFHPSVLGSFLSAMVIYASLLKKENLDFVKLEDVPSKFIRQPELDLMRKMALQSLKN